MAEPATLDLTIVQGDTYRRRFTIWTDDTMVTPVDITGWTFLSQLRTAAADAIGVAAAFTVTIIDAAAGVLELVLAPADSATLNPEVLHYWDLQATTDTGDITTLMAGQVTVIAEISRPVPAGP